MHIFCRLCGKNTGTSLVKNLFDDENLFDKISGCLPVQIEKEDDYSKYVCNICMEKILCWLDFIKVCETTDRKLKKSKNLELVEKHENIILNKEQNSSSDEGKMENNEKSCSLKSDIKNNSVFCIVCHRLISLTDFDRHKTLHCDKTKLNYPCIICKSNFNSSILLNQHLYEHFCDNCKNYSKNKVDNVCKYCCQSFIDPKNSIYNDNTDSKKFRCEKCKKTFRHNFRLEIHETFHEKTVEKCKYCDKTYNNEMKLYKHVMYNHLDRKYYNCDKCTKKFNNKSSLKYHYRCHNSLEAMKPFKCEICKKMFAKKSNVREHIMNKHGYGLDIQQSICFQCKICHQCFLDTKTAISHMDGQHVDKQNESGYQLDMLTVSKLYLCEYCNKVLATTDQLVKHRIVHKNSKTELINLKDNNVTIQFTVPCLYYCEFCEKCFKDCFKYLNHVTTHQNFNNLHPYKCQLCSHVFNDYESLMNHKTTHNLTEKTPDCLKKFECLQCEKGFTNASSLTKHIRVHSGERPYLCEICNKCFSQSSGLNTHLKVHSDVRQYSCDLCEKSFKIIGDYKLHMRNHSGVRHHKCDYCDKSFLSQQTYSQHRKLHTSPPTQIVCEICKQAFTRAYTLKKHLLKHKQNINIVPI